VAVNNLPPPSAPAWVRKRDGRVVPFEADRVSRALFAATESLGRPDAFLARELTDGVVHFLAADGADATPSTAEVADLVVKVVRELGHPALAEAFAEHGRRRERTNTPSAKTEHEIVLRFSATTTLAEVVSACRRAYSRQAVFARDLVAAQGDGLLTLTGLEAPDELAGCVLESAAPDAPPGDLLAAVEEARRAAGRVVVLDGPEYRLGCLGATPEDAAQAFVRDLRFALRVTDLEVVVNLNSAVPPSWADDLADGPLFADQRRPADHDRLDDLRDRLVRVLPAPRHTPSALRADWHLAESDFRPEKRERLEGLSRLALETSALAFVFDRPRRSVVLAEGVDRAHPAILLVVGLHLPRLAEQSGRDPDRFLRKLETLARLAVSAAVQKREYLRRRERSGHAPPALGSGFLVDRACLVAAVVGLDAVVCQLTGSGLCAGGASLDLGRRIVAHLRDVLRHEGRAALLETCVDAPSSFCLEPNAGAWPEATDAAGLTPWEPTAPVKSQLRAGAALHAGAASGTLAIFLPADDLPTAEQVADWLRLAWRQGEVNRLRLMH
jgi:hypothetical protein